MASTGTLSSRALVIAVGAGLQTLIAQVGVNLVLVRVLPDQETFGSYRQVMLIVNTLLPIALLGIHMGLYFYLPRIPMGSQRAFMMKAFGALSVVGWAVAALIFLSAPRLAGSFDNASLTALLRSISPYFGFLLPTVLFYHYHVAGERAIRATVWNLCFFVPQSILIVFLALEFQDLLLVLRAMVVLAAARYLWSLVELVRIRGDGLGGTGAISLRSLLAYSVPLAVPGAVAILGEKLDKFVVSASMDPGSFAVYSVGAMEFPLLVLLAAAAVSVMRGRLSALYHAGDLEGIRGLWEQAVRKLALGLIPGALYLFVFAPELITLLYTDNYADAVPVFRLYLVLVLLRVLPGEPVLASAGRAGFIAIGGAAFLVLDLVLNLAMVQALGLLGPPLATIIATAMLVVAYLVGVSRVLGVGLLRVVPYGPLLRILAVALISTLPALLVQGRELTPVLGLLWGGLAMGLSYTGLALLSGTVSPSDFRSLMGRGSSGGADPAA